MKHCSSLSLSLSLSVSLQLDERYGVPGLGRRPETVELLLALNSLQNHGILPRHQ